MNAVREDVEKLVQKELESANQRFEKAFHSDHEGYALLKEEIEEAQEALNEIDGTFFDLWYFVRDNDLKSGVCAKWIAEGAVKLACEAIQVAAMAQKFIDSQKEREKSENN